MRENDEFIGQLEDYLVEFDGDTPLPGRVMDAIHAELPRTRRAKAGPGFMRMPPMQSTITSRAPLGIAAAVVVAVVLGAAFINRNDNQSAVGGVPGASPTSVPSQGTGPAASSDLVTLQNAPDAPCPGITDELECLEPGTYQLGSTILWPAIVTLTVPENWWYYLGGTGHSAVLVQTEDVEHGSGWGVIFSTVGSVSLDPCDTSAGTLDSDVYTPGQLYEVIKSWPGFDASEPQPISNGYDGVRFTLTSTKTSADCPASQMWTTANSSSVEAYPMVNPEGRSHETEFRIFDIDGKPLVVMAMDFPETSPFEEEVGIPFDPERHVDHQIEMNAILDSIELKDPHGMSF